jgi:non-specific serine/threonine protein kinase
LRGAIAWSYELLTSTEQWLFECLAVFSGGFSLEAAEAVGNADAGIAVLDGLTALVDQSLIQIKRLDAEPAEPRFELLETIREYALERLAASGHELGTRDRHSAYFLALAESADAQLRGPHQVEWLARLEHEHDNLRAALRWCIERQDAEGALRFGGALWRFWQTRGHVTEGRQRLTEVLAPGRARGSADSHCSWRAAALSGAGNMALFQGDMASAKSLHEESLAIRRRLNDRHGIAGSLNNLGNVAEYRGDHREARLHYQNSLAIHRESQDDWGVATVLYNLGYVAWHEGDDAAARLLYEESLAIGRQIADRWVISWNLAGLADVAQGQGDTHAARLLHEQCLTTTWELGDLGRIAPSLEGLAGLAAAEGHSERALRLAGAAARQRGSFGSRGYPSEQEQITLWLAPAWRALSEEAGRAAWAEGQAMSTEQAVVYALQLDDAASSSPT